GMAGSSRTQRLLGSGASGASSACRCSGEELSRMFLVLASRGAHSLPCRHSSRYPTSTGVWRSPRLAGGSGSQPMPLTDLQKGVLAVLAANRSEESHFAGGIVLNAPEDSPRFSRDFDIFHELAAEVVRASESDVVSLRAAGFTVKIVSRYGEWE